MTRGPKRIRHADNRPFAIKSAVALQVEAAMKEEGLSKAEMARRMHTSRAAINRLLNPVNGAVTLSTLQKAAVALGREIHLELVSGAIYKRQE